MEEEYRPTQTSGTEEYYSVAKEKKASINIWNIFQRVIIIFFLWLGIWHVCAIWLATDTAFLINLYISFMCVLNLLWLSSFKKWIFDIN